MPPEIQQLRNLNPDQILDEKIQGVLDKTKSKCLDILIQNYSEIIEAFKCLEMEREPEETADISVENCNWLALYCFLWFFSFKLPVEGLLRYKSLFNTFGCGIFVLFFRSFQTCDKILRYLIIDILWQITFLKDQFTEEDEVIVQLYQIVKNSSKPLQKSSPALFKLLPKILKTPLVSSKINNGIVNDKLIEEFVSKIYLVPFPPSIQGLTLFNSYITIKERAKTNAILNNEPIYQGYTLLTAIHEFGHFLQRVNLNTSLKWLDHETPEHIVEFGNHTKICESGTEIMTKLFGYDPLGIKSLPPHMS